MLLGCIADDFTGASDVGNTLRREGMATSLLVGVPGDDGDSDGADAGVVALKIRSAPAGEAVAAALRALAWLRRQGCEQILFKYCSTFDSTPAGNIGPVAEALLDALEAPVAVACPAFPETGRSVYQGHLFVGRALLNESGMERHPLTPMTDANLPRWLGRQSRGEVGLVDLGTVRRGAAAIRAALAREARAGRRLAVVDALDDRHLRTIARAVAEHRLVTGASGVARGLPANFRRRGRLAAAPDGFQGLPGPGVVLSGSRSAASRRQLDVHLRRHPGLTVEPRRLADGSVTAETALGFVLRHRTDLPAVHAAGEPDPADPGAAARLERFFGRLAVVLAEAGVTRLAVGGGETAGAVVGALGIDRLRIGPEIDPGVPALSAERPKPLRLVLKSGNFGSDGFYEAALAVLEGATST